MDKIDLQIMDELSHDARKPFREIAKKIGVSTQTVIKRYNEMKEKEKFRFAQYQSTPTSLDMKVKLIC